MTRKVVIGITGAISALTGVLLFNTFRFGQLPDQSVPPVDDIVIDWNSAALRLAEAIRFRTVSYGLLAAADAEAFDGFHKLMSDSYPKVHARLKRERVGAHSLLYYWEGSDPTLEPVLLAAHMDVVPVEPGSETDWTHPPFAGAITDGFIWGRGALDMKYSVMAVLEAVEFLIAEDFVLRRSVYLAFGHDEELGGENGAAQIARLLGNRGVRLDFTLDEGLAITQGLIPGVTRPVALIGLAEKGGVVLEITARGSGGHSSMPRRNATIVKLAQAIVRLESNQMPARLESPATEMFEVLAPEMPLMVRALLANRWLFNPLLRSRLEAGAATNALIRTTTATTVIASGIKHNVLPRKATAIVNFRILPGDSIAETVAHARTVIDDPDVSVSEIELGSEPTRVADSGSASFATVSESVRQIFPEALVAPGLALVRTDSRHYEEIADNSYRFLPLRVGPEDLGRLHGVDERIAATNYAEIIRFYVQLLRNSASPLRRDEPVRPNGREGTTS